MTHELFDLRERVAAVCGGAGGIGRRVARGVAEYGAAVVVVDIDAAGAAAAAREIEALGGRAAAVAGDITTSGGASRCVDAAVAHFGRLDVLVNAVGANIFKLAADLGEDEIQCLLTLNLTAALLVSRAAAEEMRERGGGKIINFASVTALFGSPGQSVYAAAKAGLVNLTKSLALEWAADNIQVNAVSPVMTETAINAAWLAEHPDRKAAIARTIPAGRLGRPDDLVGPVVFLASRASDFVTGQTLFVDGGTGAVHPLVK
jgi:2-deoxy-D-gluconate 3-dehydrogenase